MSELEHAIQEARRLSGTREGRQLAVLLGQLGGADLQQAMDKAAAGDLSQAKQLLEALMQNPKAVELLRQLGGTDG